MENKNKILIVEDEGSLRSVLRDKFVLEGFSILEAKDGEEGLKIALQEHPDLILLDLLMPKMNGIEMAKKLRQDDWGKNVKIIILTNLNEVEKVQRELEGSIYEYLVKSDVKINEIVEKVKHFLEITS